MVWGLLFRVETLGVQAPNKGTLKRIQAFWQNKFGCSIRLRI